MGSTPASGTNSWMSMARLASASSARSSSSEGDVAVLLELVALHDLAPLDHLVVVRAVELLLDARPAGRVQQVERELLGVGRHVDADRDGHEPEADRPRADGAGWHAASFAG